MTTNKNEKRIADLTVALRADRVVSTSQVLATLKHYQYSDRCDLCLMGERHTNVQHDQRVAARKAGA